MTHSQKVLLSLLSEALFQKKQESGEFTETDWLDVLEEAENQAVVQLSYSVLNEKTLPLEAAQKWKQKASADIAKIIRVSHNHALLHEWLSEACIPYVVLKGCSSAFYYPEPASRSMGDVDFLVPSEYLVRAGEALETQGLRPWSQEHISHIVYRKDKMHLEMHFNVAGTPNGKAGDLVREYMRDVFEKATVRNIISGQAMIPAPFHHGLIILLHTCHHLTGEGIGLRHLCDWAVFANHFTDSDFCDMYEDKLKTLGLWRFAQALTRTAIQFLGADEKAWAVCDDDICNALMEDILTGGNFGRNDSSRDMQTMLISDRGKNGVGRTSMSAQFTQSINQIICQKWPQAKTNKLLIPIGWAYFGTRRLFREITGKREKTDLGKLIEGASERRALYSKLNLYERETV